MPPLDAAARRAAALKAHATRKANKAYFKLHGHLPPKPKPAPRPVNQNPFATKALAKPKSGLRRLEVLALMEKAFVAKCAECGLSDELRHAWEKYQKSKDMALNMFQRAGLATEDRNVVDTAFRVAIIQLVKVVF